MELIQLKGTQLLAFVKKKDVMFMQAYNMLIVSLLSIINMSSSVYFTHFSNIIMFLLQKMEGKLL